jgi:hypothetical protein
MSIMPFDVEASVTGLKPEVNVDFGREKPQGFKYMGWSSVLKGGNLRKSYG